MSLNGCCVNIYMMQPRIYLCWFPEFLLSRIQPVLTLEHLLDQANRGDPVAQHRMGFLNWIVQDLCAHGMRKPIIIDHDFATIVGDNRIMALRILNRDDALQIPVLAQLRSPQGHVIQDVAEIPDLVGLNDCGQVSWRPIHRDPLIEPVDWIDVGDRSTVGHSSQQALCERAMQHYLDSYPDTVFTPEWCLKAVDWQAWAG